MENTTQQAASLDNFTHHLQAENELSLGINSPIQPVGMSSSINELEKEGLGFDSPLNVYPDHTQRSVDSEIPQTCDSLNQNLPKEKKIYKIMNYKMMQDGRNYEWQPYTRAEELTTDREGSNEKEIIMSKTKFETSQSRVMKNLFNNQVDKKDSLQPLILRDCGCMTKKSRVECRCVYSVTIRCTKKDGSQIEATLPLPAKDSGDLVRQVFRDKPQDIYDLDRIEKKVKKYASKKY